MAKIENILLGLGLVGGAAWLLTRKEAFEPAPPPGVAEPRFSVSGLSVSGPMRQVQVAQTGIGAPPLSPDTTWANRAHKVAGQTVELAFTVKNLSNITYTPKWKVRVSDAGLALLPWPATGTTWHDSPILTGWTFGPGETKPVTFILTTPAIAPATDRQDVQLWIYDSTGTKQLWWDVWEDAFFIVQPEAAFGVTGLTIS